uniref:Uncharacterized protein n=1 Tax=Arundo donax TaxID=35708 RepID=A0A0A8ZXS4_ARUDO
MGCGFPVSDSCAHGCLLTREDQAGRKQRLHPVNDGMQLSCFTMLLHQCFTIITKIRRI